MCVIPVSFDCGTSYQTVSCEINFRGELITLRGYCPQSLINILNKLFATVKSNRYARKPFVKYVGLLIAITDFHVIVFVKYADSVEYYIIETD